MESLVQALIIWSQAQSDLSMRARLECFTWSLRHGHLHEHNVIAVAIGWIVL